MSKLNLMTLLISVMIAAAASAKPAPEASAKLIDTTGEAIGKVALYAAPGGTLLRLKLKGLPAGPKAIHIHGTGTCEDHDEGFQASGGHLNPDGKKHGLMNPEGPDAGDLTNFFVHENGHARAEIFTSLASPDGSTGARILDEDGAAIVIHENPDNHRDQPIGGAGARIACGLIQRNSK